MLASCVFAMIAQFAPLPFPESRPVLGVCGSLYFILSGLLQFIITYIDKDAILWTTAETATDDDDTDGDNRTVIKHKQTGEPCAVCVRSNFPRFSEFYTVTMELLVPVKDGSSKTVTGPSVTQTWSVGQFFDKEGYFYEVGIMEETKLLLERLEAGKYDSLGPDDHAKKVKQS